MIQIYIANVSPTCYNHVNNMWPSDAVTSSAVTHAGGICMDEVDCTTGRFETRFWAHVDMTAGPDGCWLWTAGTDRDGYGKTFCDGAHLRSHRVAYELAHGPIPAGALILHSCDNPRCVNPAHLRPGSASDNAADTTARGRWVYGDDHWTRQHPERLARGDDHHARRRPDRLARGDRNGSRLYPERLRPPRGESHPFAKLTDDDVRAIRATYSGGGISQRELARRYGVTFQLVHLVVHDKVWKHVQ